MYKGKRTGTSRNRVCFRILGGIYNSEYNNTHDSKEKFNFNILIHIRSELSVSLCSAIKTLYASKISSLK